MGIYDFVPKEETSGASNHAPENTTNADVHTDTRGGRTDTRKWFEIPSPATAFPLTEEELVRTIKHLVGLDIDPPESRTICNAVAVLCAVREGLEARYA